MGQLKEFGRIERSEIPGGEWVQMEELAQRVRELARDLCPNKPLGEERRVGTDISSAAAEEDHPDQGQYHQLGFPLHQSTSVGYDPVVPPKSNRKEP